MWFQDVVDSEEAGWFQEEHTHPDKFGSLWAMTPDHKLLKPEGPRDIILLSTGGFAPIHNGHIAMMEVAKTHLEAKGFRVRGGYISPGHDDYVVKYKGVRLYAPERIAYANKILANHPWLMVDPWEAIGCTCSVNFTSVIDHLERLFNCQVCYVVGSDNARFSLAFKHHGMICIVQRTADVLPNPKYAGHSYVGGTRAHIVDNAPIPGSSTTVRSQTKFEHATTKLLMLRIDESSEPYMDKLLPILEDYYLAVRTVHVKRQRLANVSNLVSLDQMIFSPFGNLGLSRNYAEGGYIKLGYINRPGTPSLEEQARTLARLSDGQALHLFDDDICSGNTMLEATKLLNKFGCKIGSYNAFVYTYHDSCEIMDSRDFLPVPEGGLVVLGKRVPYIYPYVCPYVRASILPGQAEEFSDRIRATFWS